MSDTPVAQSEFHSFRVEMRDHMKQQTELMRQMVELQTKHTNLESWVARLSRKVDDVESRLRPVEQGQSGTNEKTKYLRDLLWLVLTMIVGIAGYGLRGGL